MLVAVLLVLATITFTFASPAYADGNAAAGKAIFNAKCNVCHQGGVNRVIPMKNLKKETLEKFGMYSEAAIVKQVTYGKGAMPRFGGRLKPQQIKDVAAYVLDQADKW
ncbi:MAG: c-type cytochrome [Moorea sp. SIO2B7]|nr:c-type cytochrome [Moorena sp. SIO2B7]